MGASETKGFSATKRKKYTFKCISKGCKNLEKINKSFLKGHIRYRDKYSTKNMYCTGCKRRIQRFKFTASDDSDTESIPIASTFPNGQLAEDALIYLSPERDISPQTAREAGEIRSGRSRASYRCIYRTKPYGIRTRFRI